MNREKFEALLEIKTHLDHGNVFWSDELNRYASDFSALHVVACYVNGAYYAFCEQEKKIDKVKKYIFDFMNDSEFYSDIQELLK